MLRTLSLLVSFFQLKGLKLKAIAEVRSVPLNIDVRF